MNDAMERKLNAIANDIIAYANLQGDAFVEEILTDPRNDIDMKLMYLLGVICEKGKEELLRRLLVDGIDPSMENDYALRAASCYGQTGCVKMLIKVGANVSADCNYSLRMAQRNGHEEVANLLKESGATLE